VNASKKNDSYVLKGEMPMKLFRTKKVAFEGLKLSIKLYRLDKSDKQHFENITIFLKTILYDLMIDASLLLTVFLSIACYGFQKDRFFVWLVCSSCVYGLNIINELVNMYYVTNMELTADEKTQGVLNHAPRYMLFNKSEKERFYKSIKKQFVTRVV
jgi:hypothetical protein